MPMPWNEACADQGLPLIRNEYARPEWPPGLSLGQLARKDFSRAFINMVERGLARRSPPVLELIARRTGKPIKYLLRQSRCSVSGRDIAEKPSGVATRLRRFMTINQLFRPPKTGAPVKSS